MKLRIRNPFYWVRPNLRETGNYKDYLKKRNAEQKYITLWTNDIDTMEKLWQTVYMNNGWCVEKPIEIKFNWRRLDWRFRLKLRKI